MKRTCDHKAFSITYDDEFHKVCPLCGKIAPEDPIHKMLRKRQFHPNAKARREKKIR